MKPRETKLAGKIFLSLCHNIFKCDLSRIGSQWSFITAAVAGSYFFDPVMNLGHAFWMVWTSATELIGSGLRKELQKQNKLNMVYYTNTIEFDLVNYAQKSLNGGSVGNLGK